MKERIVVKVGTSTLTSEQGKIDLRNMERLVRILSDIMAKGTEVILVTSAAITVGYEKMGLPTRPKELNLRQAAAAVGQCELMHLYDKLFNEYGKVAAQILLDEEDMSYEKRRQNLFRTFSTLLEHGMIPIVNENDSVSYQEIESPDKLFGDDNDTLSAHVALLCNADKLILLSDIDGLYEQDPRENQDAELIRQVPRIDERIKKLAVGSGTSRGTGGMITKIRAAELVTPHGCEMYISNGACPDYIYSILEGVPVGTCFKATKGA
jgi:glutamate 5-kinase